nr:adenylate isopentenyltransferase 5, chloroplastic-like [Ipomoea batatas]
MKAVNKKVVAFVMGATGTGKSKLSVSLAARIGGEIINSDKIQVYRGLDVVGNKIPEAEMLGVPHHLLGHIWNPNEKYTARDFCFEATSGINYICMHVGLVEEVRGIFGPDKDYTKGIRRAIGVPEMDKYLRAESKKDMSDAEKKALLESAIAEIKTNTMGLIRRQVGKIRRLRDELGWPIHRIDPTAVFQIEGDKQAQEAAWLNMVFNPSFNVLQQYLKNNI